MRFSFFPLVKRKERLSVQNMCNVFEKSMSELDALLTFSSLSLTNNSRNVNHERGCYLTSHGRAISPFRKNMTADYKWNKCTAGMLALTG